LLHLLDFSPASQIAIATQMLREVDALDDIEAGRFTVAVGKASSHWASLPGSKANQHVNLLADLRTAYVAAGGTTEDA
jgi:muramidase (phage lysozyme)